MDWGCLSQGRIRVLSNPMKRTIVVVAIALLVGVLLFRGPSDSEFALSDPYGHRACRMFDIYRKADGGVFQGSMARAAATAALSRTPAIVNAVDNNGQPTGRKGAPVIDDWDEFADACEDAGYNF